MLIQKKVIEYLDRWNLSELGEQTGQYLVGEILSEILDENVRETFRFLSKLLLTLLTWNELSDIDLKRTKFNPIKINWSSQLWRSLENVITF